VAYAVLSVAYLISPYLIIRRSMIIADESYCGSSSVGIEHERVGEKKLENEVAGGMNENKRKWTEMAVNAKLTKVSAVSATGGGTFPSSNDNN